MDIADLLPYEEVHIFNVTNGHRFSTYVIEGKRGSNVICVNGAAAHLAREGDCLIIANFSPLIPVPEAIIKACFILLIRFNYLQIRL